MEGLFSQSIWNCKLTAIHLRSCFRRGQRGQVALGASDALKELRSALRLRRCRQFLVARRHFRSTHETSKVVDVLGVVVRVWLIVGLGYRLGIANQSHFIRKEPISDAHFVKVCIGREREQAGVLILPSESPYCGLAL